MRGCFFIFFIFIISCTPKLPIFHYKEVQLGNIRYCGPAKLYKEHGINILNLYGTHKQMAYQYAKLMKEKILKQNLMPFLASFFEIQMGYDTTSFWPIRKLLAGATYMAFTRRLIRCLPRNIKEELAIIAKIVGYSPYTMYQAYVMPDLFSVLSSIITPNKIYDKPHLQGIMCSSFVCRDINKHMLHGRNLDFAMFGHWEKEPTIIIYHPINKQKYISFSSAGAYTAGITSMNESGLTLALHQHLSDDVTTKGLCGVAIGQKIIQDASTIDEAINIIKNSKRAASWSYVISSFKENKAVVVETTKSEINIRYMKNNKLAMTNRYSKKSMIKKSFVLSNNFLKNNYLRYIRIKNLLDKYTTVTVKQALQILADHYDPEAKKIKSVGNTVGTIYNIQSILLIPELEAVYIANGPNPIAHLSPYYLINLNKQNKNLAKKIEIHQLSNNLKKACNFFLQATIAYHNDFNIEKTLKLLERAKQYDSTSFEIIFTLGMLYLKNLQTNKAFNNFKQAYHQVNNLYNKSKILLFIGRCLDLDDKRAEAIKYYKKALNNSTSLAKKLILKHLIIPYTRRDARKLKLLLPTIDFFN